MQQVHPVQAQIVDGKWAFVALLLLSIVAFATVDRRPVTVLVPTPLPPAKEWLDPFVMYGWASWYGVPFHGRKTADGTVYDMGGYSVAHKTMKLGTFVRITNLRNGLSCIAIVNDRGPYIEGRDWDLSRAVARRLKAIWKGVVPVKVEVIQ
jgi:rare lipoprotein A